MNHHLYLLTLSDQLFRSPIEPSRAIDIGTGTGLWAIDLADRYPNCEVTGVDLSPVPNNSIPPNCNFEVDDANSEWTYPENHFDLVYVRGLNGAVDDWSVFYKEAYRCIAPDGYVEDFEYDPIVNLAPTTDPNVPEDNFYNRFSKLLPSAGEAAGKTFARGERMIREMESAGFVDIRQEVYYWPIGPWSSDPRLKEMGRWMQKVWEGSLEGWILGYFTRVLGWTYDQVQAFVAESRVIMRDRRYHAYHKLHCTYGRKPRPEEIAEKPEEMDTSNSVAS
ncbi:S-adenosyl-L-methionine-dependent methyltransferase [Patellaria atrata CBS 101060]|uniref:S-adenosyl-L-methionine-dependent methyltransferase n=1 Tax=Patellaria atrata CBS 101060 TaxID=1346257 RepID=A0A9P4SEC8_9PEZI|nr:S-adenosyl-L-methionine-dependent methyltransferase [Patellaria atrata CBS 101060]